jgi:molybdenum cofactor cytidylyltransferase
LPSTSCQIANRIPLGYIVLVDIHAILLAAGRSRRLGRAKQLVRQAVSGGPSPTLLARAAATLSAPPIASLRIVLGAPDPEIDAEAARTGARIVRSEDQDEGTAASIRAGVRDLQALAGPPAYGILFAVVDQPAMTPLHINALVRAFGDGGDPVASRYAETIGVPAIFPSTSASDLLALRGDKGAKAILLEQPMVIGVDLAGGECDIDLPGDLEAGPQP